VHRRGRADDRLEQRHVDGLILAAPWTQLDPISQALAYRQFGILPDLIPMNETVDAAASSAMKPKPRSVFHIFIVPVRILIVPFNYF
jgi:hypothetical protein